MVRGGVEVLVGATLDPTFGPLVLYGSGGILVELLNDVAFRINPLTDLDVRRYVERGQRDGADTGLSGSARGRRSRARELILRVSALVEICPQIHEMDANPVKVLEKGAGSLTRAFASTARLSRRPRAASLTDEGIR